MLVQLIACSTAAHFALQSGDFAERLRAMPRCGPDLVSAVAFSLKVQIGSGARSSFSGPKAGPIFGAKNGTFFRDHDSAFSCYLN